MTSTKSMDNHEASISGIISAEIGATWKQHDDNSADGMYDVDLEYPDGRKAALEISRVADTDSFQLDAYCSSPKRVAGASDWAVQVPAGLTLDDLKQRVPALIAECDQAGVDRPDDLQAVQNWYPGPTSSPLASWFYAARNAGLTMGRVGPARDAQAQIFWARGAGGVASVNLRGLDAWINTQVTEDWFTSNVKKLERSGLTELHLAVTLHDVAVPEDLLISFMKATTVDQTSTLQAGALTDLWLLTPFAPVYVRWSSTSGWRVLNRS
ncbi:hypothetical protein [Promicromonospora sp. NFX87]|uniref:hypothetical protein n=1 Tax=Promicromonospora sp. NFX87 TaxID=3402691 RepID=UPI003AFA1432